MDSGLGLQQVTKGQKFIVSGKGRSRRKDPTCSVPRRGRGSSSDFMTHIDSSRFGLFERDETREHVHWSRGLFPIFGLDEADGVPDTERFRQLIDAEDRSRWDEAVEKAFTRREPFDITYGIRTPDGTLKRVRAFGDVEIRHSDKPILMGAVQDLTEQEAETRAMMHRQTLLSAIAEHATEVFWVFDIQAQRIVFANPAFEQVWGYSLERLLSEPGLWERSLHPEDRARAAECLRDMAVKGEGGVLEYRILNPDGRTRWIRDRVVTIRGAEGEILSLAGISEDVTEARIAASELRQSEAFFRTVFDQANDGILVGDAETMRFVMANDVICDMLGYDKAEIERLSVLDIHPTETLATTMETFQRQVRKEIRIAPNIPVKRNDGSVFLADVNSTPITIEGKTMLVGIFRDATERHTAEAALRANQKRYADLFEFSPISLWEEDFSQVKEILDDLRAAGIEDLRRHFEDHPDQTERCAAAVKILDTNQATVRLYGAQCKEQLVQNLGNILPEQPDKAFLEGIIHFAEGGRFFETEARNRTLDGRTIDVVMGATLPPGFEDSWSRVLVSIRDITRQKETERQLDLYREHLETQVEKRTRALQEANHRLIQEIGERQRTERQLIQSEKMAALGTLVASIAHEINNPNSFITFNIPILGDYLKRVVPILDEHAKSHPDTLWFGMDYHEFREDLFRLLDNVAHGSKRINTTVSDLRDYVRTREHDQIEATDLALVLNRALAMTRAKISKTVRDLDVRLSPDLPRVWADPAALERVFINALINAAQAADKPDSRITIQAHEKNGTVVVEISDNGCGMDAATLKSAFDPFFTTKTTGEGTGLGLYVCREVMTSMGGEVDLQSQVGEGTTLRLTIPRID